MGSSALEQQKGCSSPTSCTTNLQSINTSPIEKETDHATSNLSTAEEKASLSMNLNINFKNFLYAKDDAAPVAPSTSIKLFGKTVKVKVSPKPSVGAKDFDSQTLPSMYLDTCLSLGTVIDNHSAVPSRVDLSTYRELCPDKNDTVESTKDAPLPWWAFPQGLPFYHITSSNQTYTYSGSAERMGEKEILNDRSCSGSNSGSVSESVNRKNSDSVDSKSQQPESPRKCSDGFVPYKRCLEKRHMSSSVVMSEVQERQRARVY